MYVHLLSSALDDWADELSGPQLVDQVRLRRAEMLTPGGHDVASAGIDLAAEVAYDCALIKLSAATGIEVTAERFTQPRAERARLERALATAGVDITSLARSARVT